MCVDFSRDAVLYPKFKMELEVNQFEAAYPIPIKLLFPSKMGLFPPYECNKCNSRHTHILVKPSATREPLETWALLEIKASIPSVFL